VFVPIAVLLVTKVTASTECEALVNTAAEVGGTEGNVLLCGSKWLLTACNLLITSEEEIVSLMEIEMEAYKWAYQHGALCWQH
jgi:hypothetical protein